MSPERWKQIEAIYSEAQQREPAGRMRYLMQVCGGDEDLRKRVEAMLHADSHQGILDLPLGELDSQVTETQLKPGTRLGAYLLEDLIGAGGMGEVYRATDTRLGRKVAIKFSKSRFSDRFEREARATAALNHPNICILHDVGPNYLVMELVEGETLAVRLQRGKLTLDQVIQYGCQIADAMAAAHAKGITHRDLKPGNIMLTRSGLKVLDFGLAKSTQDASLTAANAVIGTPAYMAPEQRKGLDCDARTDIYALGVVIAEMATGVRPVYGEPIRMDSLSEKLAHLIDRCLAEDPDKRWQTALDVKAELQWSAVAQREVPIAPVARRSHWAPFIAVAAVLGLVAATLAYLRKPEPQSRVLYASILPPEKTTFDFAANSGPVVLSPDGRHMVFAATSGDGSSQLWIRALDAIEAKPLPGTRLARFPFWSPDSRWIGFFAEGILKKLDTRGGMPIALVESAGPGIGASWSPKGQIVFAASAFSPLLKVSSDGGKTSLAVETEVSGHGFPWFLPDGEHFLFASWLGSGHMTLRVGSLSATSSVEVGEADSNAIYSTEHLLYLRGSSLVAQPFDIDSLHTTGEPKPLAENIQRFMNLVGAGVFSASDSGILAYQVGADAAQYQLTWFDRSGRDLGILDEPRAFWNVELSPDGRTLLASSPDEVGNFDLWAYDLSRKVRTRFTSDPGGEYFGVWSADGQTVVFNSTRQGHYDLYRKSASGNGPEELLFADATDKVPRALSPDGQFLVYSTGGGQHFKLWRLPLTPDAPGDALKPVPFRNTRFDESAAQISRDGRWVAYDTTESGRIEVYIAPFARPTEKYQISTNGGMLPRWRPDGKGIYFQEPGWSIQEADLQFRGEQVEVTGVRSVFAKAAAPGGYGYIVSPDGQRALAARPVARRVEPITVVENWTAKLQP